MYYMGFSYNEAMSLPVWQRVWFIERMMEEIKRANGNNRSAHDNAADSRYFKGNHRTSPPAKLRRFT